MSFRERADEIINEVNIGANTRFRVGNLLKDIGANSDVVSNLTELRQASGYVNGDTVFLRGHTVDGLGAGRFTWDTTPICELVTSSVTIGTGKTITVTATTEALAKELGIGDQIEFENGAIFMVRESNSTSGTRVYEKGTTSLYGDLTGDTITAGMKAYFPDDNGTVIKPTFVGFDNHGRFKRIVLGGTVTPQDFGVVHNFSLKAGPVNECSEAFQAALDSRYAVNVPGGAYYVSNTLILRKRKSVKLEGLRAGVLTDTSDNIQRQFLRYDASSTTTIYTDQNIDVVKIWVSNAEWLGGTIDTGQCPNHNRAAFLFDGSFRVTRVKVQSAVIGNEAVLMDTVEGGTRAFWLNYEDKQNYPGWGGSLTGGYITGIEIKTVCIGIHSVLYHDSSFHTGANFTNGISVDFRSDYAKYAIIGPSLGTSKFEGSCQSRSFLREEFRDEAVNKIGGASTYCDIFVWDMTMGSEDSWETNTGRMQTAIEITGTDLGFGRKSLQMLEAGKVRNPHQVSTYYSNINSPGAIPKKTRSDGSTMSISRFENHWALYDKKSTVTVNKYKAPNENWFDNNLEDSAGLLPDAPFVEIINPLSMFSQIKLPTRVVYSEGSDNNLDFVEVVLYKKSGDTNRTARADRVFITLQEVNPIRIQYIKYNIGESPIVNNITSTGKKAGEDFQTYRFSGNNSEFDRHVFRFIGLRSETGIMRIADIFAILKSFEYELPYIHFEGGQRIYGSLDVETPILRSPDGSRWTIDNTGAIVPYS